MKPEQQRSLFLVILISLSALVSACETTVENKDTEGLSTADQSAIDESALDQVYQDREAALSGSGQINTSTGTLVPVNIEVSPID